MEAFQTPEVLYVLAEISVAVVGFTGVVVALRFTHSTWSDVQRVRFSALIGPSLTALVACFFPEFVSYFCSNPSDIWRLSNLGIAIVHLANIVSFISISFQSETNPTTTGQRFLGAVGGLTILAHLFAAANIIPFLQATFVFGVIQQLGVGILNFVLCLKDSGDSRHKV
jgi:hypothetical protein